MLKFLKRLFLVIIGERHRSHFSEEDPFRALDDEELVKLITKEGNTLLFGIIYDRYAQRIYNKCNGFARSEQEALDLTQDVFLHLFVKLGGFQGRSKFSSWVYALTYNFCVNYVNRNKARKIKDQSSSIDDKPVEMAAEVADRELFKLRSEKLQKALEHISPEDKTLLLLKYQDDVSIKEIGSLLELGESAVKMRLKRAKARVVETYNSF